MSLPDQRLIRPALVLAGSVLSLLTGLLLIVGHQTPAVVRTGETPAAAVTPDAAGPSSPTPAATAGPRGPSRSPRTPAVPRSRASISPPEKGNPRPVRIRLDPLGVTLPIQPVGVTGDGAMELPDDPGELGWYRFGPEPGAGRGSAVLAGHVDSREYGIGPLAELDRLRPGDVITVITAAGSIEFTIERLRYERRSRFPAEELFDRTGPSRLVIITCGGPYTPGRGYRDNLIVTATPAG